MTAARSKLALGTAQFGQQYGVANISGQVSRDTAAAILELAGAEGMDTLDTAVAYGASEACLGEVGIARWRVITKLPPLPGAVTNVTEWVERQVRDSLQRLGLGRLEGLLLHDSGDLRGPHAATLLGALASLKSRELIAAAGISIYDPQELDALWPSWHPDIVQAPCNVLDRRLVHSGWLAKLARQGVRVHLRSVFLQGLLLMPCDARPAFFGRWQATLDHWLGWCAAQGESPLQLALAFGCGLPGVERVVVGVESVGQLRELLAAAARAAPAPPQELCCEDPGLIEPRRWELQ
ncbi:MAG: aldo/keto reductase [Steroidobacteraceae bacterium]